MNSIKFIFYTAFLIAVLLGINLPSYGQQDTEKDEEETKFGVNFSGYVKNSYYYDSRQVIGAREGHLLLFPANVNPDIEGVDLNDQGSFHFLSIQSRIVAGITAPDAFGAKVSGGMEAEFFGNTELSINEFRLRHAYIIMDWGNTELLTGQYWHPLFITECFPGTVSFSTGTAFQPFSRNPQIRLTQKAGNMRFILAAVGERDFATRNFSGAMDNNMLRNSKTPQFYFQTHYISKNPEKGTEFAAGFGAGYKSVMPQNLTGAGYKTNELLHSFSAIAFTKFQFKPITIKLEAIYGENMTDLLYIGGFAIRDTLNAEKQIVNYTPMRNAAGWIDVTTNGKVWQVGAFAAYHQNLGTKHEALSEPYGFYPEVGSLYRVSGRIIWNSGRARVAAELEYSAANYGDGSFNNKLIPQNTNLVENWRVILGTYLFF